MMRTPGPQVDIEGVPVIPEPPLEDEDTQPVPCVSDPQQVIRRQQATLEELRIQVEVLTEYAGRADARANGLKQQLFGLAEALMHNQPPVIERKATGWLSDAHCTQLEAVGWFCIGIEEDGTFTWLRLLEG